MSEQTGGPVVLIVTGLPASGKTSLARWLAAQLGWPYIGKDEIKETLFDTLGWRDREWSQLMGRATIALLYQFARVELAAGRSFVIESNFDPKLTSPELTALQTKYPFRPIQIQCYADGVELFRRFKARAEAGDRHPGHTEQSQYAEFEARLAAGQLGFIDLPGPRLSVDTTDFAKVSYPAILAELKPFLDYSAT